MWDLTIGVLEVNPELDSIRAQRGRARSALFSRVNFNTVHWRRDGVKKRPKTCIRNTAPNGILLLLAVPLFFGQKQLVNANAIEDVTRISKNRS